MASAQTTLPFEIERLIFELAAQDDRKIFPVLLLVCQRARTWLEPQLYHTLRLDHRSTRINASALKSIARRPPEFIGKHVRNLLLVAGVRTLHPSVLVSFLRNCASLEGLVIIGDLTGRWLLEPLAETGVKRLGIEVGQLFENSVTGHGEISEDEDEDGEADDADGMVEEDALDEVEEEYDDSDEEQPGIRLRSGFIDIADDLQDDSDEDVESTQNPDSDIDASPSVDLSHPLFRSVTHLDILDGIDPEDEELADMPWLLNGNLGAASLPALTHLSFNSPPHPAALRSIMQSSFPAGGDSTLKVLLIVFQFTASEAALARHLAVDYVATCPDPRVVVATYKDYYADWERGARGRADDIWFEAEQLVAQRSGVKVNVGQVLVHE